MIEDLVIDARCLQDGVLRHRGIGRVLRNLLIHRKDQSPGCIPLRATALLDDGFPTLSDDDLELFDETRPISSQPAGECIFLNPAPMSLDPLPPQMYISSAKSSKIAICLDFIPFEMPKMFLYRSTERLRYMAQLVLLSTYDFYFPISEATDQKLRLLFNRDVSSLVIGCPIRSDLTPAKDRNHSCSERTCFLVIGDPSDHKDVVTAVRGHARFLAISHRRIPLIITGSISDAKKAEFSQEHKRLCGDESLLDFVGIVDDGLLERLYRSAIAVIVPSRAEGFSMPVIEAMCCESIVVASDIDAHRALVPQKDFLFQPGDYDALASILAAVYSQSATRDAIVHENQAVWTKFAGPRVAAGFWNKVNAIASGQA